LDNGGGVLRLAGLYNRNRGAHAYYLRSEEISGSPDHLVNLLHYDDAAGACIAALRAGPKVVNGKTFLISDGNPKSRKEQCEIALLSNDFSKQTMPTFLENVSKKELGKVYDGTKSNTALSLKPKYKSFDDCFK